MMLYWYRPRRSIGASTSACKQRNGVRHSHISQRFPPLPPLPLPPFPPFPPLFGPSISSTSLLLNLNVPPLNLPTAGAPTPLSLLFPFASPPFPLTLSNTIPFSLASDLLVSSLTAAFFIIPLRCDSGIFSCTRIDLFAPSLCTRRSVALCLFVPLGSWLPDDEERRCDSDSRRCRARSFLRFAASETSEGSAGLGLPVDVEVGRAVGGLEDWGEG